MIKYPPADNALAKSLTRLSYILTAFAFISVGMMRRVKIETDFDFSFVPGLNAMINTLVAICLILAYSSIRKGDYLSHRKYMIRAVILSGLFFVGYILYHFTSTETVFCREGSIKIVYYFILITHIVLAGLSLPFILLTFVRGFTYQIAKHKKLARWVFPIWLYVAISGPITYLLLKPCYYL
jgi:putative membrane protein